MPLSWNEIKDRSRAFSRKWADESSEDAEAKSFWDDFFQVFGVSRRRIASFEEPVKKSDGSSGFIDLLWKGILLVEHKSRGKSLDKAFSQAKDYFPGLKDRDLPRYVLVSDFARFRLYDLDNSEQIEFELKDLHKHVALFGFISGYQVRAFKDEDPANIKAAERMGNLHDALKDSGYEGHTLEVFLVRLLFCLFAEDTGIFDQRRQFQDFIEQRTAEDGSDLGSKLTEFFQALNTPPEKRQKTLDKHIADFPYVNGKLFAEILPTPAFDSRMREELLNAAGLDWSQISPAIFGALFQSIMDAKARRNLGAHYTSEKNILKLIHPLFLDDLRAEFEKIKTDPKGRESNLLAFQEKLASLTFLDPACGCGNFLVIAYRELRLLELEVILALHKKELESGQSLDPRFLIKCNVDQFYGIEIEEFPAQIAQVALWLTDHQLNLRVQEAFGNHFVRLPLDKSACIVHANALRIDWNTVIKINNLSYIMGNPPFVGQHYQTETQKQDQSFVLREIDAQGVLDFVCNWYVKSAEYIQGNPLVRVALVSTSSITQGEQVGLLWPLLLSKGVSINFAHRTFQWTNEASGQAAVHCVIIGFGLAKSVNKIIFDYENPKAEPSVINARNINPYLIDAQNIILKNRSASICDAPKMKWGNKPTDGGNLILSAEERKALLSLEPEASEFIRPYMSGGDFINGEERYCLWLANAEPKKLKSLPLVMARIEAVKAFRLASKAKATRDFAQYPYLFRQISQPNSDYLAIPEVSSERRNYIPIAFLSQNVICSNKIQFVPEATNYHFGVLQSLMHMAWTRAVCGRLESRISYSNTIVYNNYPWPVECSEKQKIGIESAAQMVLDVRAKFPSAILADLYDPLTMPQELVKAHQALDAAVDSAYSKSKFKSEAERVAFLFERYQEITSLFPIEVKTKRSKKVSANNE